MSQEACEAAREVVASYYHDIDDGQIAVKMVDDRGIESLKVMEAHQ